MYKYNAILFYYGHINKYFEDDITLDGLLVTSGGIIMDIDKKYFSIMYKVSDISYSTMVDRLNLLQGSRKLVEEIK